MIIGDRGAAVVLDARTCAVLERYAGLSRLRLQARGLDQHVSTQLDEIRQAAEHWRRIVTNDAARQLASSIASDPGTEVAELAEPAAPSTWLSTAQAGRLLRVTSRAVVGAIARGELTAERERPGTAWRITPEAVEHYRQITTERNRHQ